MVRTLSITAVLTGIVGFTIGWFTLSAPKGAVSTSAPRPDESAAADAAPPAAPSGVREPDLSGSVAVVKRFALRPGDVSSDRETPAVAIAPDGTVVLAWASQAGVGDNLRTLYVTRSTDGGATFDAPVALRTVPIYRYTSGNSARSPERKMAFSTHVLPPPDSRP